MTLRNLYGMGVVGLRELQKAKRDVVLILNTNKYIQVHKL